MSTTRSSETNGHAARTHHSNGTTPPHAGVSVAGVRTRAFQGRSDPAERSVTKAEELVLANVVNTFYQIVACAKDGWSIKAKGPVPVGHDDELKALLAVLLNTYSIQEIRQRLAWIFDDEGRYMKLCTRLERVQELLGNVDKGTQAHPFVIKLGTNHPVKECEAFTSGLRSGVHLKALKSTHERWIQLKGSADSRLVSAST